MGWKRIGLMRRPAAGGEDRERVSFFPLTADKKPYVDSGIKTLMKANFQRVFLTESPQG